MNDTLKKLTEIQKKLVELTVKQDVLTTAIDKSTDVLEKLKDSQNHQAHILLRNTITVEEHQKRSILLERKMGLLEAEIAPIKDHVQNVIGVGKAIKWIAATATAITATFAALKLMSMILGG